MTRVYEIERVAPQPKGLVDGGHLILACSNCDKKLIDIFITQPTAPFKWRAKAKCWSCGDESFWKEFEGRFSPAGFGKETVDGQDFDNYTKMLTPQIGSPNPETDVADIIFPTAKGDKQ